MPELFIELFSEEIPARMQKRAEEDLDRLMREKLAARGLQYVMSTTFSSPSSVVSEVGVTVTVADVAPAAMVTLPESAE